MYLESIFIGSEDIRLQLPEDSKRFDGVDTEFKRLMVEMAKTPNVVKATNVDGLAESLQGLMDDLTKCEKALAEYLDTKRLAFPRYSGRRATQSNTPDLGSTLLLLLTCWTSCPTGTTRLKWPSISLNCLTGENKTFKTKILNTCLVWPSW